MIYIGASARNWRNLAVGQNASNIQLRQTAFEHASRFAALNVGIASSDDLAAGLSFQGERIPLINPQRGIFQPRQMAGLLSIQTVFPRTVLS
jgi:putative restriction endonuclease